MSTRCNIQLIRGQSIVWLYRHHDGYLHGTGADIAEKVAAAWGAETAHRDAQGAADHFLRAIFAEQYEATSHCGPRPIYELTNDVHGDIEYIYQVCFDRGPQVGYGVRRPGSEVGCETMSRLVRLGKLEDFVRAVNADIDAANRRLAQLKVQQPAHFGQYEPQAHVGGAA